MKLTKHLTLPPDTTGRSMAILAQRGSGKTYTAMKIAELLHAENQQIVCLDPVGVWWGLRAAGSKPGLDFIIMGGEHADVPLEPEAGEIVAEFIVTSGRCVVLDMSLFASKAAQTRFVAALASRMFRLKSTNRAPIHLMLDEADDYCLSDDTEILSDRGWLKYDQIQVGTRVSCFDMKDGVYRFEPVQRVSVRKFKGEMVSLKTKSLDCLATPDHRSVIRRSQRAKGRRKLYDWTFCQADKVPCHVHIPHGGAPIGDGLPGLSLMAARVLGWLISDGCVHYAKGSKPSDKNFRLAQASTTVKRGVRIAEEMRAVLADVPGVAVYDVPERITFNRKTGQTRIKGAASKSWYFGGSSSDIFAAWVGSDKTRIPRNILNNASKHQLEALYQGLMEGDGSAYADRSQEWRVFYPGLSEGLADDFQELALKLGLSSCKTWTNAQWFVHVAPNRKHHCVRRPGRVPYDGIVWDVTVPTGAFVARRNGKIFTTGNCPQHPMGYEKTSLAAFEEIVRRGRSRGFGVTMITQRPACLNKNVLTQVDALMCMRMVGKHDIKEVVEWTRHFSLEISADELRQSLPCLGQGELWFWSPSWLNVFEKGKVLPRVTADTSMSPVAGSRAPAARMREVDLAALSKQITDSVERAKENDPKALKARVRQLEAELAAEKSRPAPKPMDVLSDADRNFLADFVKHPTVKRLLELLSKTANTTHPVTVQSSCVVLPVSNVTQTSATLTRPASPPAQPRVAKEVQPGGFRPNGSQQRILDALAFYSSIGINEPSLLQVGAIANLDVSGGHFSNTLGPLTSGELVRRSNGHLSLTAAGTALAKVPDRVTTLAEYHNMLRSRVLKCRSASHRTVDMLNVILAAQGQPVSNEDISTATGIKNGSGHFSNTIGPLSTLGFIRRVSGLNYPTELLYPDLPV